MKISPRLTANADKAVRARLAISPGKVHDLELTLTYHGTNEARNGTARHHFYTCHGTAHCEVDKGRPPVAVSLRLTIVAEDDDRVIDVQVLRTLIAGPFPRPS